MITSVFYVVLGIASIFGMVFSFFFFTATIFDLLLLIFPFFDRFVTIPRQEYFNSLYGSPKTCCVIVFILSSLFLLLFKFSYPYLVESICEVLS